MFVGCLVFGNLWIASDSWIFFRSPKHQGFNTLGLYLTKHGSAVLNVTRQPWSFSKQHHELGFTWTMQLYSSTSGWCFPKIFLIFTLGKYGWLARIFFQNWVGFNNHQQDIQKQQGQVAQIHQILFAARLWATRCYCHSPRPYSLHHSLVHIRRRESQDTSMVWIWVIKMFFWKFSAIYFGRGSWKRRFPYTVYDMKISIQQNLRYYCNYYPKVDIFQDFPRKLHIFIYRTSKAKGLHFAEIFVVAEEPLTRDAYFTFIGLVVVLLGFAIYQLSPNSTSFGKWS